MIVMLNITISQQKLVEEELFNEDLVQMLELEDPMKQ